MHGIIRELHINVVRTETETDTEENRENREKNTALFTKRAYRSPSQCIKPIVCSNYHHHEMERGEETESEGKRNEKKQGFGKKRKENEKRRI